MSGVMVGYIVTAVFPLLIAIITTVLVFQAEKYTPPKPLPDRLRDLECEVYGEVVSPSLMSGRAK